MSFARKLMKSAWELGRRHFLVLLLIAAAVISVWRVRNDPYKAQAIAAFFAFVASAILLAVSWEYVRANQSSLRLMQAQWERQRLVLLRFGVKRKEGKARAWVANLGYVNVLLTKATVRKADEKPVILHKHMILTPGRVRGFDLPDRLWAQEALSCDIDLTLEYESPDGRATLESRSYNLLVVNHKVIRVKKGLDDLWPVTCPKCKKCNLMCMKTDGLTNFQEAEVRQKQMEEELSVTCPDHQSPWLLTIEHVREQNAKSTEQQEEM